MKRLAETAFAAAIVFCSVGCTQPNSRMPDGGSNKDALDASKMDVPADSDGRLPRDAVDGTDANAAADAIDEDTAPGPETGAGKMGNGLACSAAGDCDSGHCVEGVCCNTTCTDKCSSCLIANTGKSEGTCAAVQPGSDPHNDCDKGSDPCGLDGTCDGAGACRSAGPDVMCKAESCTNSQYTGPSQCDGKGACVTPAALSCGNYPCANNRCNMTCSATVSCLTGFYCAGTMCQPQKGLGSSCGAGSECVTGNCIEGFCCDGGCSGKCQSCLAANTGHSNGQCAPVKSGTAHGSDCQAGGTTCGLDGTCDGAGACRDAPAQKTCAAEACSAGKYTGASQCNGQGSCVTPTATSCGAYSCGSTQCKSGCTGAGDCAAGYSCVGTSCTISKANGSACPLGSGNECASGICVGGVCCSSTCTRADQSTCGQDATCDATGQCHKWSAGTPCAVAMCTADNKFVPARNCDGNGTCQAAPPDACGQSACDITGCKRTCASASDCVGNAYCDSTGHCAAKKNLGASCSTGTECAAGNCVEGVCCDGACGSKCYSCLATMTGATDGQCKAVKAGTKHATDCAMSDPTTCGSDSSCDGAGSCRKWPSGTLCKGASCPNGSSTITGTSACDGVGNCVMPAAVSCLNYSCDGSMSCRSSCTQPSDCSPTAYCANNSCKAKNDKGSLCGADQECKSGMCSGRCCDFNSPCMCPQPSQFNLIHNPGFDIDFSSWTIVSGNGSVQLDNDALGCPFSHSGRIVSQGSPSPQLSQCVTVAASTTYDFGSDLQNPGHCLLDWYSGANCTGSSENAFDDQWLNVAWRMTSFPFSAQTNPDTKSARIWCYAGLSLDDQSAQGFNIDYIFLSQSPNQY